MYLNLNHFRPAAAAAAVTAATRVGCYIVHRRLLDYLELPTKQEPYNTKQKIEWKLCLLPISLRFD